MSSINQYIDLLNANRESIDSHSAGALNAARQSPSRLSPDNGCR